MNPIQLYAYRLRKKFKWEFFPAWVVYTPIFFYVMWLGLRARCFTFYVAANPGVKYGGLFAESKSDLLRNIPKRYLPETQFINKEVSTDDVLALMQKHGLEFPIILKPDMGERGNKVAKINNQQELAAYLSEARFPLILQDFITEPEEFGVSYYRLPGEKKGVINSIVLKGFLKITGDGQSTLGELIKNCDRCQYHLDMLWEEYGQEWETVLPKGETRQLNEIGNHCKGTTFINGNHLITPDLAKVFDPIVLEMDRFYVGRFDLKAENFEALKRGEFLIMEVNAVGGEPGHIYDPEFPLSEAYKDLFKHWRKVYEISLRNLSNGTPKIPFLILLRNFYRWKRYMRTT